MAGLPVVITSSGGMPVSESDTGVGLPVEIATNGYGIAVTIVDSGGLPVVGIGPVIVLSMNTVPEDESVGTVIGTFSIGGNVTGNWLDPITYTLTDDAGGLFAIDGDDLEVDAALDYETASSHEITVEADNGTDDPISRRFTIIVTDVDESATLATPVLTLDPSSDTGDPGDGITSDDTPTLNAVFDELFEGDLIYMEDNGSPVNLDGVGYHTVSSGEAAVLQVNITADPLSLGPHSLTIKRVSGVEFSNWSDPLSLTIIAGDGIAAGTLLWTFPLITKAEGESGGDSAGTLLWTVPLIAKAA